MTSSFCAAALLTIVNQIAFCQSDLVVGSNYQLNIQRQNGNADAYLLHNAQYHSSGSTFSWNTSHPSFGSRGIKFSYVDGIHFFADNQSSTSGTTFTPPTKFFIGNNGRVGIGTIAPSSMFEVVGPATGTGPTIYVAGGGDLVLNTGGTLFLDGNYSYGTGNYIRPIGGSNTQGFFTSGQERIRIAANGFIGLGNNAPQAKVHISNGDLLLQNTTSGYPSLYLKDVSGSNSLRIDYNSIIGAGSNMYIRSGSGTNLFLNDTGGGKVGIGTISPDQKLTVKGKIHAEEVIIDLAVPAPDYVFEKTYDLKPLDEVKKYINENKHLPEVPSAKEMEKDGVKVGEMEMILLKKIEELTLYMIESREELQKLKAENDLLRLKNELQDKEIKSLQIRETSTKKN